MANKAGPVIAVVAGLAGLGVLLGVAGLAMASTGPPAAPVPPAPEGSLSGLFVHRYGIPAPLATAVIATARRLGTDPRWLAALIDLETAGKWKASTKNPTSSATGLIQITDKSAAWLGTTTAALASMTEIEYLEVAEKYLRDTAAGLHYDDPRPMPLDTIKRLSFSVFWPPARDWPADRVLPDWIQAGNPHIVTVGDYVQAVKARIA